MCVSLNSGVDVDYIEKANIVVRNVSKRYVISESRSDDANTVRASRNKIVVDALTNVSLIAEPGESVGLIGLNGSGKSTLLKLIAGGETPTSGEILVRHQPMLMGVSPALQQNLSGEANIYLGCLALGMTPKEATDQVSIIAEWTELGDAIKRPLSTYSSGMGARLGFAISTAVNPDILLIDEALSTGDAAFGAKAQERMSELLDRAGNLFLVSHSIGQIEKNCKRTIWINKGCIISDGPTAEVAPTYHEWARLMGKKDKNPANEYLESIISAYKSPIIALE